MINLQNFTTDLESWYREHGRNFPWRSTSDPYAVWVSEIMSHQTQIDRVATKFYPRFLEHFPTVEALASATWEEVYPVWEGLGYYQRGKNMLKAAKIVVEKYNGSFPDTHEELITLPGVGAYTAAAILSFAHDAKIPAVDTNIQKIIRNLWPEADIIKQAEALIALSQSGRDWNSAMMDLSSQLRQGKGVQAPLEPYFTESIRQKFVPKPKKRVKKSKKVYTIQVGAACIHRDGKYLIQSRPEGKSFVGFWEFPGGKREPGESFRECVKREIIEEIGVQVSVRPHFMEIEHDFGSKKLLLRFHRCQIQAGEPAPLEGQKLQWVAPTDFDQIKFLETNHEVLKKLQTMRV